MVEVTTTKIKPIELIACGDFEEQLVADLKLLFQKLPLGDKGYVASDFSFKAADDVDIQRLRDNAGSHAFTWYDKARNEQKIYFDSTYFECSPDVRSSYFLHELCHYIAYSSHPNSAEIVQIKGLINEDHLEQSKKLELGKIERIPEEVINRIKYVRLLSAVNETIADNLMIEIDESLYREKLLAQINDYTERVSKLNDGADIYTYIIDLFRSIDIIKERKGYDVQVRELNEIAELLHLKLKGKLMKEKIAILLSAVDDLRSLIRKSDTINILPFFEKLIGDLSSFSSVFIATL